MSEKPLKNLFQTCIFNAARCCLIVENSAIEMLEPKFSSPEASFDVRRIIVDGDLAVIHLNGKLVAGSLGVAFADVFRLENGKIVEHWDVVQSVPTQVINP
jgi:predicted SnoaL-like aldol condensation-catalyzing enzyme